MGSGVIRSVAYGLAFIFVMTGEAQVTKNIVTDFGATCNGSSSDASAFASFVSFAQTYQATNSGQITLVSPSGATCLPGAGYILSGINNLLVSGYGSTWTDGAGTFNLGGHGVSNSAIMPQFCRTATVAAGAAKIFCLDTTQTAQFVVGNWAIMTGLTIQSASFPPNLAFHDYALITGVNTSTGEVDFTPPLTNSYESTWPLYSPWGPSNADQGGPATLYWIDPSWNTTRLYQGLTISQVQETGATARSVTYQDMTFTGAHGVYCTQNQTCVFNNVTCAACNIEVDKLIDNLNIINSNIYDLNIQSSPVSQLVVTNSNITLIKGTPDHTTINGGVIGTLALGPWVFGRALSVVCNTCNLGAISPGSFTDEGGSSKVGVNFYYSSMANGIITLPNSLGPVAWAIPGTLMFWPTSLYSNAGIPFKVIDVTQDATNTYIQTTMTGTWPPLPTNGDGKLFLRPHPAPAWTCNSCTGSADAIDLSQATPGLPIYSYSKRTYSGNISTAQPAVNMWGRLISIKVNVSTPYTGIQPTLILYLSAGGGGWQVVNSAGASVIYNPLINLKVAGTRTLYPGEAIGAQSGDSGLLIPGAIWLGRTVELQIQAYVYTNIGSESPSTWPTVSIEIVTDQTIVTTGGCCVLLF